MRMYKLYDGYVDLKETTSETEDGKIKYPYSTPYYPYEEIVLNDNQSRIQPEFSKAIFSHDPNLGDDISFKVSEWATLSDVLTEYNELPSDL